MHWFVVTVCLLSVGNVKSAVNILKPGQCPTLAAHAELDWSKVTGEWKVLELSKSVSCPCNGDIRIFVDKISETKGPETTNKTLRSITPSWTRMTVSAPVCRNPEKHGRYLHWELEILPNPARAGIAVVRPPYPWDLFGFGSMTIVSTDYDNYAVIHFCNSLLLEHVSLPLVLQRERVTLDAATLSRVHFSLELQGISTWDMENVNDATCDIKRETPEPMTTEPSALTSVYVDANTGLTDGLTAYYSTINQTLILHTLVTTLFPPELPDAREDQMEFPTEETLDYNPKDDAEWLGSEFYTFRPGLNDNPVVFPIDSEFDGDTKVESRKSATKPGLMFPDEQGIDSVKTVDNRKAVTGTESGVEFPAEEDFDIAKTMESRKTVTRLAVDKDWKPILVPIPPSPEDGKLAHMVNVMNESSEMSEKMMTMN